MNVLTHYILKMFEGSTGPFRVLQALTDGPQNRVPGTVRVWDVFKMEERKSLLGHYDSINDCKVVGNGSPDLPNSQPRPQNPAICALDPCATPLDDGP